MDNYSIRVPLADPRGEYLACKTEIDQAIQKVLDQGNYVAGSEVLQFETEFAAFCGAKYCVGVSSGTDALYLSFFMLNLIKDSRRPLRVATTDYTFFATPATALMAGCEVKLVDVDFTGNIDVAKVPWSEIDVYLPVHLYGRPAAMPTPEISKGVPFIVEDSAQAHGHKLKGDIACFSFYPTKNLGAIGQGGAIVTNNERYAGILHHFKNHSEYNRFIHHYLTGNHRLDELQAAILRVKLRHVEEWNKARRKVAARYRTLLDDVAPAESDLISGYCPVLSGVKLPLDCPEHIYHIYAITVEERDKLAKFLADNGIQTGMRYPAAMHTMPALKHLGYDPLEFPMANFWARTNLSLPMSPFLTSVQVEYVAGKIKEWVTSKK